MKIVPAPFNHQREAEQFLCDKDQNALFMEQGTGKSKVVIDLSHYRYINRNINSVIVISPNAVKDQWVTEQFPEHYPEDFKGFIWDGMSTQRSKNLFFSLNDVNDLTVFSFNVESFQSGSVDVAVKYILNNRSVYVIVDESTRIKNGRRKTRKGKRAGAKRTNKIIDLFSEVQYKSILTGTPTPNSPFDLWSQFEFLIPDFFGMDYFYFTHHYGILLSQVSGNRKYNNILDQKTYSIIKNRLNKLDVITPKDIAEISIDFSIKEKDVIYIKRMEEYSGYKNLDELRNKISTITFFKNKSECLDLPPKVYETLNVEMGKEQKRIYEDLKKSMYAEYMTKELTVQNKMVMALRLQMITGGIFPYSETTMLIDKDGEEKFDTHFEYREIPDGQKIKVLLEDLQEVSSETSVIIWARFRGEILQISKALTDAGYYNKYYFGGSDISIIDEFKSGELKFLVGSPLKGGEGLNLQISNLQYWYSNSFKADSRLQGEDRSHRIGQKKSVLYKDLICKGTIDERVYQVIKRKESIIEFFRGKEFERILQ